MFNKNIHVSQQLIKKSQQPLASQKMYYAGKKKREREREIDIHIVIQCVSSLRN